MQQVSAFVIIGNHSFLLVKKNRKDLYSIKTIFFIKKNNYITYE